MLKLISKFSRLKMKLRVKVTRFKFFCFILGSAMVYIVLMNKILNSEIISRNVKLDLKYIVVHIDLKGAPPKLEYLESLIPLLKGFGVNGVIMEYEDMFPYVGNLVNLSSRNRYARDKLKNFLTVAMKHEIEVIPLVQTFGHLEHVLKLNEFKHLRELEDSPDSICPSNPKSIMLIQDMLEQVITFHNSVTPLRHIHIGCDEVYHINKCDKCFERESTVSKIFTSHVFNVSNFIKSFNSSIKVLIWDDMMRNNMEHRTNIKSITSLREIEPVYWDYKINSASVSFINLYMYHKVFKTVWISTAFKGADGRYSTLPLHKNRLLNHYSWLTLITDYTYREMNKVHFEGIILTGWSRYSHMDPLCELLPASLSSLILNLLLIRKFHTGVDLYDTYKHFSTFFDKYLVEEVSRELNCASIQYQNIDESISSCKAHTSELVHLLRRYQYFVKSINIFSKIDISDNVSLEYYSKMNLLNMNNIISASVWCKKTLNDIVTWKAVMQEEMAKYYDKFVIDEYVGSKIYAMVNKLTRAIKIMEDYKKIRTWDRGSPSFPDIKISA